MYYLVFPYKLKLLIEKQGIVLATGGGSIISKEVRNKLSARGIVVYLETPIEKQLQTKSKALSTKISHASHKRVTQVDQIIKSINSLSRS